jgi:hypothetical protein
VRFAQVRQNGNLIEVDAIGHESAVYTQTATGAALPYEAPTITVPGPANMVLIDGPILRDADDVYGIYAAGGGYGVAWAGGKLYRSSDSVTYTDTGVGIPGAAPIGYCTTTLPNFSGGNTFDALSTLRVSLLSGSLSSISETSVLNGNNGAMVGDELVQFQTATLVSAGVYDLSRFIRGRQGTEWAMGLHGSGERFVLLADATTRRVDTVAADQGVELDWKLPTYGTLLETAQAQTLAVRSNRLKPLQPAHLTAYRNASLDLIISWTRRARIGAGWIDGIEVPLDETTEAYEADMFAGTGVALTGITRATDGVFTTSGGHGLAVNDYIHIVGVNGMTQVNSRVFQVTSIPTGTTFTVGLNTSSYSAYTSGGTMRERARVYTPSTATATYTAANQTTDYGSTQATIYIGVCQTSSRVGRGYITTGVF